MLEMFTRRISQASFDKRVAAALTNVVTITANTTLDPALHHNKILQVNAASNITLTLPATGPVGFTFVVDQVGVGRAIFAVAGSATKRNRNNYDRTAGQDAQMSGYVRSNAAGNNAVYALSGDGAAS